MTNLPVTGVFSITATYGQQGKYWSAGHKGIDFVCENRDIYSTCDGVVRVKSYDSGGWGYYVSIGDDNGNRHIFCHLAKDSITVKVGDKVTRTTKIATMGSTGNSTGVHLHYQLNNANNVPINPCEYLGIPNEKGTYNSNDYAIKENEKMRFNDYESIAKWARPAVDKVSSLKIMNGDDSGNFNPKNNLTREEAAQIIYNLFQQGFIKE